MKRGPFICMSAGFPDDKKVIDAGEKAAWLYVVMACESRTRRTDGTLPRHLMPRLGVPGWQSRVARLIDVGLVERTDDGGYHLRGYLNWNPSEGEYLRRSHKGRADVCRRHHAQPCERPACIESIKWLSNA